MIFNKRDILPCWSSVMGCTTTSSNVRGHTWHLWHRVIVHIVHIIHFITTPWIVRIVHSLARISLHLWARWASGTNTSLPNSGRVTCNRLKSKTSSHFLIVKNIAILTLLLHLHYLHLAFLLPLHDFSLTWYLSKTRFLLIFDVLLHPVLIHLTIKYALVRIFHLVFIHALLLNLLLCLRAPLILTHFVCILQFLLFFLLFQSEVCHVFRVNVCLLV